MGWLPLVALSSHFSMVGFALSTETPAAMAADAHVYLQQCTPTELADSKLVCVVRDATGAELWFGLTVNAAGEAEMAALNPAFAGKGSAKIVVDGDVSPADFKPFENRIQARVGRDEIPLILDLADPGEAGHFTPGAAVTVDITAFADDISLHETEAAYYASQSDQKISFASNHFIPSGMFGDEGAAKVPTAHALFAGQIVESELRRNEKGKRSYWRFLVRTLDGVLVNVVADPADVKAAPKVGGYLAGSFWMSARLSKS